MRNLKFSEIQEIIADNYEPGCVAFYEKFGSEDPWQKSNDELEKAELEFQKTKDSFHLGNQRAIFLKTKIRLIEAYREIKKTSSLLPSDSAKTIGFFEGWKSDYKPE